MFARFWKEYFCERSGSARCEALDEVHVPFKNELRRFATWLPAEAMRVAINGLLEKAIHHSKNLDLKRSPDLEDYFLEIT